MGTEAAFHSVDEYMAHAVAFFDELDARLKRKHTRRVFIASDEASVIPEARNKYVPALVLHPYSTAQHSTVLVTSTFSASEYIIMYSNRINSYGWIRKWRRTGRIFMLREIRSSEKP